MGVMILLSESTRKTNIMHYNRNNFKRIVRTVLGGETYAFTDALDVVINIRYDLSRILQKDVKLTLLTDFKSLGKVIINSTVTTEKRLMIDIDALREE